MSHFQLPIVLKHELSLYNIFFCVSLSCSPLTPLWSFSVSLSPNTLSAIINIYIQTALNKKTEDSLCAITSVNKDLPNAQFWTKGEGTCGKYPPPRGNLWLCSATLETVSLQATPMVEAGLAVLVHRSRCLFSAGGCGCRSYCSFIAAVFRLYKSDHSAVLHYQFG